MSSKARLWLLLGPVAVGIVAGYVGAALHPSLAVDRPALLIVLNPRNYHLFLVAGELSFALYFTIAFVRLTTLDPLLYLTGRWYGAAGRRWVAHQVAGSDGIVRFLDKWFPRISWPIVFVAPNTVVCLLAGVTRMRPVVFVVLNVTGTIARISLIWWLAGRFTDQLDAVLDFFERYQMPATLVAIALVAVQILVSSRRGSGELEEVRELGREIAHEPDDLDPSVAPPASTDEADRTTEADRPVEAELDDR